MTEKEKEPVKKESKLKKLLRLLTGRWSWR